MRAVLSRRADHLKWCKRFRRVDDAQMRIVNRSIRNTESLETKRLNWNGKTVLRYSKKKASRAARDVTDSFSRPRGRLRSTLTPESDLIFANLSVHAAGSSRMIPDEGRNERIHMIRLANRPHMPGVFDADDSGSRQDARQQLHDVPGGFG